MSKQSVIALIDTLIVPNEIGSIDATVMNYALKQIVNEISDLDLSGCIPDISVININACVSGNPVYITSDLSLMPTPVLLGDLVSFTHTDFGSEVDIIEPGVTEITRGLSQGLYNSAQELGYVAHTSPAGTEWNSVYTGALYGFGNLADVGLRTYSTWRNAVGGNPPNSVGMELVMHDTNTGKYYTVVFTQWTSIDGNGGGFAYDRQEITVTPSKKIIFGDGSTQDTAPSTSVVNSASANITVSANTVGSTTTYTLNTTGGGVNYTNVAFVDLVHGDNATANVGRFDQPFATIAQAAAILSSGFPNSTNRALVYLRKGTYTEDVTLRNYVDVYCEAGASLTGTWSLFSAGVTCNVFGYGSWSRSSTSSRCFSILDSCTLYLEGQHVDNTGAWGEFNNTSLSFANIVMNFKRINATGDVDGYGVTIRSNVNLSMDVKEYVRADHSVFDIRTFSGKLVVNTPVIILGATNILGGDYKHCLVVHSANVGSAINITTSEFRNEQTGYLGGTSAMIFINAATDANIVVKGNILGGDTIGIRADIGAGTKIDIRGNIKSNVRPITISGAGTLVVRDSYVQAPATAANTDLVYMDATTFVMFKNCIFRNDVVDGNIFNKNSVTGGLSIIDCIATSEGASGYFITSPVAANTAKIHNVRSNKALHVDVTDVLVPSGHIVDVNILTPSI